MPKFTVRVHETHLADYVVEAENPQDAIESVRNGNGELADDSVEFLHLADEANWAVFEGDQYDLEGPELSNDAVWSAAHACEQLEEEILKMLGAKRGTSEVEQELVEHMDELVHDVASKEGSDVNNGGLSEQLEWLWNELGAEHARTTIIEHVKQLRAP
jgi:hypothetical protein